MLRVPRDRLPVAPLERHAALRSYFCDKDAEAHDDGSGWSLELSWPDGHERHVDPRLDEGLAWWGRSEEHTSELQSLMRISYAVFCLKKNKKTHKKSHKTQPQQKYYKEP